MTGLSHLVGSSSGPCAACSIRHSSVCGALSSAEITDLNALARPKHINAGQTYVMEGDHVRDFANITQGVAKLVRGSEDGRSQIVGLVFQSDFIGEAFGEDDDAVAVNSIEAVTDLDLCLFPRAGFEELLARHPSLEQRLLRRAFDELSVAREWMVLLGRKTAEERVASFFLHVAKRMQNNGCHRQESFDIPLGRADIADYIGLTIETVSRQITKLRKEGILELEGTKHVVWVDQARLKERAGF